MKFVVSPNGNAGFIEEYADFKEQIRRFETYFGLSREKITYWRSQEILCRLGDLEKEIPASYQDDYNGLKGMGILGAIKTIERGMDVYFDPITYESRS